MEPINHISMSTRYFTTCRFHFSRKTAAPEDPSTYRSRYGNGHFCQGPFPLAGNVIRDCTGITESGYVLNDDLAPAEMLGKKLLNDVADEMPGNSKSEPESSGSGIMEMSGMLSWSLPGQVFPERRAVIAEKHEYVPYHIVVVSLSHTIQPSVMELYVHAQLEPVAVVYDSAYDIHRFCRPCIFMEPASGIIGYFHVTFIIAPEEPFQFPFFP